MIDMSSERLRDEFFGELSYDPPVGECSGVWLAEVALTSERRIEVMIFWNENKDGPFSPYLQRVKVTCQRFLQAEENVRHRLAAAMLDYCKQSSSGAVECPSIAEVAQGLTASGIQFSADGRVSVNYSDAAELFADHYIEVSLDVNGRFIDFALQG